MLPRNDILPEFIWMHATMFRYESSCCIFNFNGICLLEWYRKQIRHQRVIRSECVPWRVTIVLNTITISMSITPDANITTLLWNRSTFDCVNKCAGLELESPTRKAVGGDNLQLSFRVAVLVGGCREHPYWTLPYSRRRFRYYLFHILLVFRSTDTCLALHTSSAAFFPISDFAASYPKIQ